MVTDQNEMDQQQTGITDAKMERINLPPKKPKSVIAENVNDQYEKEHQQTGRTDAKMKRINLPPKNPKSIIAENVASTSTSITQDCANIGNIEKQKAAAPKQESTSRFNINPLKVVLKN